MRRAAAVALIVALVGACTASIGESAIQSAAAPAVHVGSPSGGAQLAELDLALLVTTAEDAQAGAAAVNAFGFEIYDELRASDPDAGLVLSPTSIALALAMARAGARGQTAEEMDLVLHGFGNNANPAWVAGLEDALNDRTATFPDALNEPQQVTLRNVHAAFAQQGLSVERAYLEALATRFAAGVRLVDYADATEAARRGINEWVAETTEDRIDELIARGQIDADTRIVLVNAMYLKAAWLVPFLNPTQPAPFTLLDGTTKDVQMMHASGRLSFASRDGWKAVEIPYVGEQLGMLVIVPDDLTAFEATLDLGQFDSVVASLEPTQVDLAFPKFGVETRVTLNDVLAELGMPTAFGSADFSGITRDAPLQISAVVHQANIDVDEAGTEAAAATAVVMRESAVAPGIALTVDRPYVFSLRDRVTGAILFLGRVTSPAERGG